MPDKELELQWTKEQEEYIARLKAQIEQLYLSNNELIQENEKLKTELENLLSCAKCSENHGGYICDKEYNDKCLAQKIQYIKELEEEIEELKEQIKD